MYKHNFKRILIFLLVVLSILGFSIFTNYNVDVSVDNVIKAQDFNVSDYQVHKVGSKAFFIEFNFINDSLLHEPVVLRSDNGEEIIEIDLSEAGYGESSEALDNLNIYTSTVIARDSIVNEVLINNEIEVKRIVNIELKNNIDSSATTESIQAKKDFFNKLGLNLIPREDWGASSTSLWYPAIPSVVNKIVVHHTVTNINTSNPSEAVRFIYELHKNRCSNNNGSYNPSDPNCDEPDELWQDIGYNYVIDQLGNIYEGRVGGNGTIGAHSPPNSGTIGIAIIGDFSSSLPTAVSRNSLTNLIASLSVINNFTPSWGSTVVGHSDRNATLCPGTAFYSILPSIVNGANSKISNSSNSFNVLGSSIDTYTNPDNYIKSGNTVEIVYRESSEELKENVLTNVLNIESTKTVGPFTIMEVDEDYLRTSLIQVLQSDPDSIAQTRLRYTKSTWDNTDLARSIPSDYDTDTHWYLDKIKLPEAWKLLGGCESDELCGGVDTALVAVIDTGVAYEDFLYDAGASYVLTDIGGINMEIPSNDTPNDVYNEGYDREYFLSSELSGTSFVSPYDAVQDLLCIVRESNSTPCNFVELDKVNHANDDEGHGTAVTNVIVSNTSDVLPNQLVGIAHNVSIIPIKAFYPNDSSMCYDSLGNNDPDCLEANSPYSLRSVSDSLLLYYAIDHAISNGADVINMSLTGFGTDPLVQSIIDEASSLGVVVVVASGNNNGNTNDYFPAGMSNVINVGAINSDNARSSYSNYGTSLDLVAPVGDASSISKVASQMFSCSLNDSCFNESNPDLFFDFTSADSPTTFGGTSFAAPQVSSAVALLKSLDPTLSFRMVETLLKSSTTDINTKGFDNDTGWGMLNLERLINNYNNPLIEDDISDVVIARYSSLNNKYRLIGMYSSPFNDMFVPAGEWNSSFGSSGDNIKSGDFNGDGALDILSVRIENNQLAWRVSLASSSSNTYLPETIWNSSWGKGSDQIEVGDFDGDGDSDVMIVRRTFAGPIRWIVALSNGVDAFVGTGDWNSGWGKNTDEAKVGDFDGDGDSDVMIVRRTFAGPIRWIVALSNGVDAFVGTGDWNSNWGKSTDIIIIPE